jgi:hypothetical protein
MKYTQRKAEHLNIRDAALKYEVSRSKLHRLVRSGQLRVQTDPRDGRASLLNITELEAFFSTPDGDDLNEGAGALEAAEHQAKKGYLTAEARARIDALRIRASGGRRLSVNSADIIQEARDSRTLEAFGDAGKVEA